MGLYFDNNLCDIVPSNANFSKPGVPDSRAICSVLEIRGNMRLDNSNARRIFLHDAGKKFMHGRQDQRKNLRSRTNMESSQEEVIKQLLKIYEDSVQEGSDVDVQSLIEDIEKFKSDQELAEEVELNVNDIKEILDSPEENEASAEVLNKITDSDLEDVAIDLGLPRKRKSTRSSLYDYEESLNRDDRVRTRKPRLRRRTVTSMRT